MTAPRCVRPCVAGVLFLGLVGCDVLFTDPAPATPDISVSFAIEGAAEGGVAEAFDRVDRAYLLFTRADSVQRDTIVTVSKFTDSIQNIWKKSNASNSPGPRMKPILMSLDSQKRTKKS